ncbi:hypothetical protein DBR32_10930 [Taibaiella sp. KBW10]|uniref:hypothetical protein n=1 Tax=Taibaiella sp. KBW10 TaxID=2153357 RepID=UPI000F5988DB|nr:hypothetical protein [Taibaiella sp. KBW10]RQO30093.1 hypothetical protein DBR32_10930 [Taibaiella sp. KBW10]
MYRNIALGILVSTICLGATAQQKNTTLKTETAIDGKNIVRLMPVTIFNEGVGLGLSYERILDANGRIGFTLPLSLGIRNSNFDNYTSYNGDNRGYSFLVNPGIKFYPAGQRKKVSYALGASLFAATGQSDVYDINNTGFYRLSNGNFLRMGIMVNNYLQFNLNRKLNIGLEVGVGPMYLNRYKDRSTNQTYNMGIDAMGQFSFHIGYRF